jgi:hypothetical protein
MQTKIKTAQGPQFKSQNRRDRFMLACNAGSMTSPYSDRVPEPFRGSVFDPRIGFPPVVVQSEAANRSIARKLIAAVKKFWSEPVHHVDFGPGPKRMF